MCKETPSPNPSASDKTLQLNIKQHKQKKIIAKQQLQQLALISATKQ